MKFYFAGGAMEVGGSCVYVRIGDRGILFDSGIRQGSGRDPLPDFRNIQLMGGIDAILVSHAHMDHTGSLPVISKAFPNAPIYMTPMTEMLTRILLADSLKIMDRREDEIPYYNADDVSEMLARIVPVHYMVPFKVLEEMQMTLYPAGHIAGAACINLETPEGTILYTGDVSVQLQRSIEGLRIPKLRPDVMIMESTYGNRLHANRQAEEIRLIHMLGDFIQEGKKVLIPAFALGRSQEVLLILRSAMQKKELPKVPVYVDGMVRDINRAYKQFPTYLHASLARRIMHGNEPFYSDEIVAVDRLQDRNELLSAKGPAIFVSSSGMLTGGPSMLYARSLAQREDAAIVITGYQDEESPGRMLLNLLEQQEGEEKRLTLDGVTVPVKCRVEQVGLSAHADKTELMGIVEKTSPRNLFLVHGDQEAIDSLGEEFSKDYGRRVFEPVAGEVVDVEIRVRRKQKETLPEFTLNQREMPEPDGLRKLREEVLARYPMRSFTIEDYYYIWFGVRVLDETEREESQRIQMLQDIMLDSEFFIRDAKRMFLIRPTNEAEMREWQKKGESNAQDVERVLREILQDVEIRKFSFFVEEKRAELTVDFPDAFDAEKRSLCEEQLIERTGCRFTLRNTMNHQATYNLLSELFPEGILKYSYYTEKRAYRVYVPGNVSPDDPRAALFREKTGWHLLINDAVQEIRADLAAGTTSEAAEGEYLPENGTKQVEQNLAARLVSLQFEGNPIAPYKTSFRNDQRGRYMELSFLSPALGKRAEEDIRSICRQTGYRIRIAPNVNQNMIFAMAQRMCSASGLRLLKNPSYQQSRNAVQISIADPEIPDSLKEEFLKQTGVQLEKTQK